MRPRSLLTRGIPLPTSTERAEEIDLRVHEARIGFGEIQLCFGPNGIVQSQTREIKQMEGILART